MNWITISITRTAGSAPRDAGTQMQVFADHITGTIGGGALEWAAMTRARQMLANGSQSDTQTIPLGPNLGQCCGGSVQLSFDANTSITTDPTRNIWIYGAGHVGRALVTTLALLPDTSITWVDTSPSRFPDTVPDNVTVFPAADPSLASNHAPANAEHLILTYAHDIDLAICHALLSSQFGSIGLIGSATKWARFKSRLAALGHDAGTIGQIACPIGDPSLGKHPSQIAIGVATAMITPAHHRQKDQIA
tara:strand:- start:416 stop:1162 length:747 start_codon:yes stop_codon:yes gene_type:complete